MGTDDSELGEQRQRVRRSLAGNGRRIADGFFVRLPMPPGRIRWDHSREPHEALLKGRTRTGRDWLHRCRVRIHGRRPEKLKVPMFLDADHPDLELSITGSNCGITYRVDRLLEAAIAALMDARIIQWPSQVLRSDVTRQRKGLTYMDVALRSVAPRSR